MKNLVEELLRLARGEDPSPAPVSVRTVATGEMDLTVETDAVVVANEVQLRRTFDNLFGNAGKHGDTNTVRVGALDDGELGLFIEDAYVSIFVVQPSTRALLSPFDQPHYVGSNGSVLGIVDYRVETPPEVENENQTVEWSIRQHAVTQTRLLVDGESITSESGSHTPNLTYTSLDERSGTQHTFTIEADVAAELRKRTAVCASYDTNNSTCTDWDVEIEYPTETVTVSDTVEVHQYDLTVSGYRARYPNGDLGLRIYKNEPWFGYAHPDGEVRGVWRFYTARDESWDTLYAQTASGTTSFHSPMYPLDVYAYPISTGPTASPQYNVSILEILGIVTEPPTLPSEIELDVVEGPYTASYGITTRISTVDRDSEGITTTGLVRGDVFDVDLTSFSELTINESSLTLTVVETTDETVTVEADLRDEATGEPIDTSERQGYLLINDERVETDVSGTATHTVTQTGGGISARYEPAQWWYVQPAYVGDSDAVYVRGSTLDIFHLVFRIGVPVALLLGAIFLVDRITGWDVWPPWRGF